MCISKVSKVKISPKDPSDAAVAFHRRLQKENCPVGKTGQHQYSLSSSFDLLAGFGTLLEQQVAGFHRAGPSTSLDESYSIADGIVSDFFRTVNP